MVCLMYPVKSTSNHPVFKINCFRNQNPLSLNYIKILRICLYSIAIWPGEVFGENVHFLVLFIRRYLILQATVNTLAIVCYVMKYNEEINFFVMGHCYITMFMGAVGTVC